MISGEVEIQFEYAAKGLEEDVKAALKEKRNHLPVSNGTRLIYLAKLTNFTSPRASVH